MFGLQVFVIASFCVAASIQYTPFTKCKKGNDPSVLRVTGCTKQPCQLKRGTDVEAEWDFYAVADTDNLKPVVNAKVMGITTNYALPEQNACNSLINGKCPLEKGQVSTYGLKMPVLKSYPRVKIHLSFQLVDNNGNIHSCFEIDGKVV